MFDRARWWGLTSFLSAAFLGACSTTPDAETPKEAKISDEVTVQATVVSVDKETRELTLERADGSYLTVVAGDEVRNFEQIVVGNTVTASYVVSLAARRLDPRRAGCRTKSGSRHGSGNSG